MVFFEDSSVQCCSIQGLYTIDCSAGILSQSIFGQTWCPSTSARVPEQIGVVFTLWPDM